jgi:hypothetical protein
MSASDPEITRYSLKRFLFAFGIRKIIQARNQIYLSPEQSCWLIKEEFLEDGSEVEYIKQQAQKQIEPFKNNYDWMGSSDTYIDLIHDSNQEELGDFDNGVLEQDGDQKPIEDNLDSDISFLEMVNKEKLNKEEDFLFGRLGDLPEELYPFLREELINNFSKESFEVIFPKNPLTTKEMEEVLLKTNPQRESLQHLFELLKMTHKFITTKEQKKVFWTIYLSPDIGLLQLEKHFGLFVSSHLKVTENSLKQKTIPEGTPSTNSDN